MLDGDGPMSVNDEVPMIKKYPDAKINADIVLAKILDNQHNGVTDYPYVGIKWVSRNPIILDKNGNEKFNKVVEFPDYFNENSVKIVASKYLANSAKREETSLRQMIDRIADTVTAWGIEDGYFPTYEEAARFNHDLKYYQVHQYAAFNSPVYFNIGLSEQPQLSACFILDVEDNMDSITEWISTEAHIFKYGSGSGLNISKLRSSKERVKQGGFASGPISFLKASDTFAGVIRSGGTFRRAAKKADLNISHPDIFKFITCKDKEEEKLMLIKQSGMQPDAGYELSDEVFFQNSNITVRVTDAFMEAVENDKPWSTKAVLTGEVVDTFSAKELLMSIAEHAWHTGDPGIGFHDTTNATNTTPAEGEIDSTNPCGEFAAQPNQSCNLAALNYLKFFRKDDNGKTVFQKARFRSVIETFITAQDIFINRASYPTPKIAEQTKKFRALGFGFSNLGALCMYLGLPYDSDEARSMISILSSMLTGIAYQQSINLAERIGPGEWSEPVVNRMSMDNVLDKHRIATNGINLYSELATALKGECYDIWKDVCNQDMSPRNAQVSLSAPTGTTGFLLGVSTYGPEPAFSLINYKTLAGNDGGMIKIIDDTIPIALENLGYDQPIIQDILIDLISNGTAIENVSFIRPEHVAIFDTAVPPENGTRSINYLGHVKMLAAIQPFISGAISKTINMSNDCTVQDIFDLYLYGWKQGLKSLTIYRDGSKTEQIMNTSDTSKTVAEMVHDQSLSVFTRKKMPIDRDAKIHKLTINGNVEGYLTRGLYDNGELGEIFVTMSKDAPTLRGFTDALATITSIALQYGVPLEVLVDKMIRRRFEPAGFTQNPEIRSCTSIIDYVFKFLAFKHLSDDKLTQLNLSKTVAHEDVPDTIDNVPVVASSCPVCGEIIRTLGTCSNCLSCGWTSGSCG